MLKKLSLMKKIAFSLLAITACLSSCKKDSGFETGPIILSAERVSVLAGSSETISLISEGNFSLRSFDQDIAWLSSIHPESQSLIIVTRKVGRTTVRVEDNDNPKRYVDIPVYAYPLDDRHIEKPMYSSADKVAINIMLLPPNEELEEEIREDLSLKMSARSNTRFVFDYESGTFNMTMSDDTEYSGTYDWDVSGALSLNYNGVTEKYRTRYVRQGCIGIYQDFTDYYKELYPSSGIIYVEVDRFLSQSPLL